MLKHKLLFNVKKNELYLIFFVFLFNILIYGKKLFTYNISCDDYDRYNLSNSTIDLIYLSGRWSQVLINKYILQGDMHVLPYIHGIVGIASFVLLGFITVYMFNISNTFSKVLLIILISINPMFGDNLLFSTNISAWITLLLGIYGFWISHKKNIYLKITGFFLIVFAIGSYQSIIQILILILLFRILYILLKSRKIYIVKKIFIWLLKGISFLFLTVVVSTIINKIFIYYYNLPHGGSRENFYSNIFNIKYYTKYLSYFPEFDYFNDKFHILYGLIIAILIIYLFRYIVLQKIQLKFKLIKVFLLIVFLITLPLIINLPLIGQKSIPIRSYFPFIWVIVGFYAIIIKLDKKRCMLPIKILSIALIILSMYSINIFYDAASRQFNADFIRANLMIERIRTHKNYTKEPIKLHIFGTKDFSVYNWKQVFQQAFYYNRGKYNAIKYFTDLKFTILPMKSNEINKTIDYLIKTGKDVSVYPAKNSIVVYKDTAIIFFDTRYVNSRIRAAKWVGVKPLIQAPFNIYIKDNLLFFVKENCKKGYKVNDFKLSIYPKIYYNQKQYDNVHQPLIIKDFRFRDYGVYQNNKCIASCLLPDFKIRKIIIGQYDKDKILWKKELNFEQNNSSFITDLNISNIIKGDINYNIEKLKIFKNNIEISGWAFTKNQNHKNYSCLILLKNKTNKKEYFIQTDAQPRYDIVDTFKNENYLYSGFKVKINTDILQSGSYNISIVIVNLNNMKANILKTKRFFNP